MGASLGYIYIDDDPVLENRREVTATGTLRMNKNWTWIASGQRDMANDRSISAATGLTYRNECVTVHTLAKREFTRDRDIEPDTSFSVRVSLKNLN